MNCSNSSLYFEGLLPSCFDRANGRGLKNDDVLLDALELELSFLRAYDIVGCFIE
jgi:hypothetical protein